MDITSKDNSIDDVIDLESALCPIDNPNTGEYWFSIVVAGPTHPNTRAHSESEGRSLAHQGKALGGLQKAMDSRTEKILTDTDLAVSKHVKTLMARSLGWKDVTDNDKPLAYDAKILLGFYEKHAWLRDAVFAFMGDARNFLGSKSTSLSPALSTSSN